MKKTTITLFALFALSAANLFAQQPNTMGGPRAAMDTRHTQTVRSGDRSDWNGGYTVGNAGRGNDGRGNAYSAPGNRTFAPAPIYRGQSGPVASPGPQPSPAPRPHYAPAVPPPAPQPVPSPAPPRPSLLETLLYTLLRH